MEQRRVTRKSTRESGIQPPDFPTKTLALEYSFGNRKRVRKINIGKTQTFELGDLPDEVILNILSYLSMKELMNCGQVSKRIRAISHDEALWRKVNLQGLKVSTDFLEMILNNGCKHLSLKQTKLVGNLCLSNKSQLKYLDLDNCKADRQSNAGSYFGYELFEKLLASCYSLEALSLAQKPLTSEIVKNLCYQNGKTLQILNLTNSDRYHSEDSIKLIVRNCTELREVDFSFIEIPQDVLDYLANNLTPKIKKLNLYYQRELTDEHVKALVCRCNKITDLNLSGTKISKVALMSIIGNLKLSLEKLRLPQSQDIHITSLSQLKSFSRLRILDCDLTCHCCHWDFESLRKQLPHVSIINPRVEELPHHFIGAIDEFAHPHCNCLKCHKRKIF